jgi:uncharacterized membrane protein YkoI
MTWRCPLTLLLVMVSVQASARPGGRDHRSLHSESSAKRMLSLGEVISRVVPRMPGHRHIGSEYDEVLWRYRLKFLKDGRVVWVDVDARSGRVIGVASP